MPPDTTGMTPPPDTTGKTPPPLTVNAVIVAAGRSSRMAGVDKTFAPLLGIPLIAHTVERFEAHPAINEIALILAPDATLRGQQLATSRGWRKTRRIRPGGPRRQDSVYNGLLALPPCDLVVIHDGARPAIDATTLNRGLTAAAQHGAAAAGMPVKDTIKRVSPNLQVTETPPREQLWQAQTPQVFRYELLLTAHRRRRADVTDDAAMVESLGHPVRMFAGAYENIKVTTAGDLVVVETFLRELCDPISRYRKEV